MYDWSTQFINPLFSITPAGAALILFRSTPCYKQQLVVKISSLWCPAPIIGSQSAGKWSWKTSRMKRGSKEKMKKNYNVPLNLNYTESSPLCCPILKSGNWSQPNNQPRCWYSRAKHIFCRTWIPARLVQGRCRCLGMSNLDQKLGKFQNL